MMRKLHLLFFIFLPFISFSQKDSINDVLLNAAFEGDKSLVVSALLDSADINSKSYDSITALMYAAMNGHLSIVNILLYNGAEINHETYYKETAFLLAAMNGHIEVANELILAGSDINQLDSKKNSALHYAATNNYYYITEMLLFYKANKYIKNRTGYYPIHLVCSYDYMDLLNLYIQDTTNLNVVSGNDYTPLLLAVKNNHKDLVDTLLSHGADINFVNEKGHNALNIAVLSENESMVELLIEKGIDINNKNLKYNTLNMALGRENIEIARILKKHGAKKEFTLSLNTIHISYHYNTSFSDRLYFTGLGVYDPINRFSIDLDFGMRYKKQPVMKELKDPVYLQLMEQRFVLNTGITKYFPIHISGNQSLNLSAAAKVGYTWGNYNGLKEKVDDKVIFQPALGLIYKGKYVGVSLDCQYTDFGIYDLPVLRYQGGIHFYLNTLNY